MRRPTEGKSPREIRRCLKRYIAREIYRHLCTEAQSVTGGRLLATRYARCPTAFFSAIILAATVIFWL